MDLPFPNFVHIALLLLSLLVLFLFYKSKSSNIKLPPGTTGWPIIGETWDLIMASRRGNPEKFMNDRTNKYSSDVFRTSIFGAHAAVFCGPLGNKFLFSNEDKYVNIWFPRAIKEIVHNIDDGSVDDSWKEESGKLVRFLPEFLKPEAIKRYVPIMDSVVKEHFETDWSPHKQVTVLPSSKKYAFALSCRLFMSIKDPEIVARLENLFTYITEGLLSLPVNFPGTTYNRAVKGGKKIRDEIRAIIKQRRRELLLENKEPEGIDLLTRMLLASDESGKTVNDNDIARKINGILVASHDTTTSVITSVMYYLAEHPYVYEKVLKEQRVIAKSKASGELLNWDDMQKMKYSWSVVCEAMRLSSPAAGGFREAIKDFSYEGFTIPKRWKVFWSPFSTHKNPKYFPNPEKFDPSRFEGKGPVPYTFVPFGGGSHMCPGREYARLEILVFMHNVVTRYRWKKVIPNEKIVYTSFPKPVNGLPIHLHAHKS